MLAELYASQPGHGCLSSFADLRHTLARLGPLSAEDEQRELAVKFYQHKRGAALLLPGVSYSAVSPTPPTSPKIAGGARHPSPLSAHDVKMAEQTTGKVLGQGKGLSTVQHPES